MLMSIITISFIVIFLLLIIQISLSSSPNLSDPQLTPIESGFEALKLSSSFSASFFLLAVLFVMFDLELILILPFCVFLDFDFFLWESVLFMFLFLMSTLLWEWKMHGLKWAT